MSTATCEVFTDTINEFKRWQLWFPAALVIIAAVSIYDTYLIVRFADIICMMELNPVGRWLLEIGNGEVGVFVRVKLAGTFSVLCMLMFMKLRGARMLFTITTSIASYQTGLLIFLTAV